MCGLGAAAQSRPAKRASAAQSRRLSVCGEGGWGDGHGDTDGPGRPPGLSPRGGPVAAGCQPGKETAPGRDPAALGGGVGMDGRGDRTGGGAVPAAAGGELRCGGG